MQMYTSYTYIYIYICLREREREMYIDKGATLGGDPNVTVRLEPLESSKIPRGICGNLSVTD